MRPDVTVNDEDQLDTSAPQEPTIQSASDEPRQHPAGDEQALAQADKKSRTPKRIASYEILDEIGRGGMGVVYRAHDPRLKRTVALKVILSGGHAGEVELARFQTEAEAVARLRLIRSIQIPLVKPSKAL